MRSWLKYSLLNKLSFFGLLVCTLILITSCNRKNTVSKEVPVKKDKVIEAPKHNAPEQAEIDSIKREKAKLKGK